MSTLAAVLIAVAGLTCIQGMAEGFVINRRTVERRPSMDHTWTVAIRLLWWAAVCMVYASRRQELLWWPMLPMALGLWCLTLPAHRLMVNLTRGLAYRVKWHDMGTGWYDKLWTGWLTEKDAFRLACSLEIIAGIGLIFLAVRLV